MKSLTPHIKSSNIYCLTTTSIMTQLCLRLYKLEPSPQTTCTSAGYLLPKQASQM